MRLWFHRILIKPAGGRQSRWRIQQDQLYFEEESAATLFWLPYKGFTSSKDQDRSYGRGQYAQFVTIETVVTLSAPALATRNGKIVFFLSRSNN